MSIGRYCAVAQLRAATDAVLLAAADQESRRADPAVRRQARRAARRPDYARKDTELLYASHQTSPVHNPNVIEKTDAGQAALPGGKADSLTETPFQTARREAYEEIGLPLSDKSLPAPYQIEELCQMPCNLARTELGVRPCIAYISPNPSYAWPKGKPMPSAEEALLPKLDAREVAAVFSAPFHNFLKASDEHVTAPAGRDVGVEATGFPAQWYQGAWTDWHESRWRMHNFYVPTAGQTVAWSRPESAASPAPGSSSLPYRDLPRATTAVRVAKEEMRRFRVFGMTARIMVDAAREAFGEEPEFEHNSHFGDEDMIGRLLRVGRLGPIRKPDDELTKEDLAAAAKI